MQQTPQRTATDPAEFGKVAVLMGGWSAERAVSLVSGQAVLKALQARGVDAHGIDADREISRVLAKGGFDRVFIALHGRGGEDGVIQGALEILGLPYTGSGVMASALSMDKVRTKMLWSAAGVPTPHWRVVSSAAELSEAADVLGFPLVVKPAHEGSSIGVTVVRRASELDAAFEEAYRRDGVVLAEEFVEGQELTAAILDDRALPLVRIEAPQGRYDYANKYFTDDVKYHCPAGIESAKEAEILQMAQRAFEVLGCTAWGRSDLILRADGRFAFLEMNTAPGMTGHSLVPMAARAVGIGFEELVLAILEASAHG
jgi:D-alanine-D-alanine ligase